MESWPQNPEFRKNPENFHPSTCVGIKILNSGIILKTFTHVLVQVSSEARYLTIGLSHLRSLLCVNC